MIGARLLRPLTLIIATLALLVAACGGESAAGSWSARAVAPAQDAPVSAVLVNSARLGVGQNRLAFGLFDRNGVLRSKNLGPIFGGLLPDGIALADAAGEEPAPSAAR